jgi:hypothetical protein
VCSRLKYRCVLGDDCPKYRAGCGGVVLCVQLPSVQMCPWRAIALSTWGVVGVLGLCVQPL